MEKNDKNTSGNLKSEFKQYMDQNIKQLSIKYPFLSAKQIKSRAIQNWRKENETSFNKSKTMSLRTRGNQTAVEVNEENNDSEAASHPLFATTGILKRKKTPKSHERRVSFSDNPVTPKSGSAPKKRLRTTLSQCIRMKTNVEQTSDDEANVSQTKITWSYRTMSNKASDNEASFSFHFADRFSTSSASKGRSKTNVKHSAKKDNCSTEHSSDESRDPNRDDGRRDEATKKVPKSGSKRKRKLYDFENSFLEASSENGKVITPTEAVNTTDEFPIATSEQSRTDKTKRPTRSLAKKLSKQPTVKDKVVTIEESIDKDCASEVVTTENEPSRAILSGRSRKAKTSRPVKSFDANISQQSSLQDEVSEVQETQEENQLTELSPIKTRKAKTTRKSSYAKALKICSFLCTSPDEPSGVFDGQNFTSLDNQNEDDLDDHIPDEDNEHQSNRFIENICKEPPLKLNTSTAEDAGSQTERSKVPKQSSQPLKARKSVRKASYARVMLTCIDDKNTSKNLIPGAKQKLKNLCIEGDQLEEPNQLLVVPNSSCVPVFPVDNQNESDLPVDESECQPNTMPSGNMWQTQSSPYDAEDSDSQQSSIDDPVIITRSSYSLRKNQRWARKYFDSDTEGSEDEAPDEPRSSCSDGNENPGEGGNNTILNHGTSLKETEDKGPKDVRGLPEPSTSNAKNNSVELNRGFDSTVKNSTAQSDAEQTLSISESSTNWSRVYSDKEVEMPVQISKDAFSGMDDVIPEKQSSQVNDRSNRKTLDKTVQNSVANRKPINTVDKNSSLGTQSDDDVAKRSLHSLEHEEPFINTDSDLRKLQPVSSNIENNDTGCDNHTVTEPQETYDMPVQNKLVVDISNNRPPIGALNYRSDFNILENASVVKRNKLSLDNRKKTPSAAEEEKMSVLAQDKLSFDNGKKNPSTAKEANTSDIARNKLSLENRNVSASVSTAKGAKDPGDTRNKPNLEKSNRSLSTARQTKFRGNPDKNQTTLLRFVSTETEPSDRIQDKQSLGNRNKNQPECSTKTKKKLATDTSRAPQNERSLGNCNNDQPVAVLTAQDISHSPGDSSAFEHTPIHIRKHLQQLASDHTSEALSTKKGRANEEMPKKHVLQDNMLSSSGSDAEYENSDSNSGSPTSSPLISENDRKTTMGKKNEATPLVDSFLSEIRKIGSAFCKPLYEESEPEYQIMDTISARSIVAQENRQSSDSSFKGRNITKKNTTQQKGRKKDESEAALTDKKKKTIPIINKPRENRLQQDSGPFSDDETVGLHSNKAKEKNERGRTVTTSLVENFLLETRRMGSVFAKPWYEFVEESNADNQSTCLENISSVDASDEAATNCPVKDFTKPKAKRQQQIDTEKPKKSCTKKELAQINVEMSFRPRAVATLPKRKNSIEERLDNDVASSRFLRKELFSLKSNSLQGKRTSIVAKQKRQLLVCSPVEDSASDSDDSFLSNKGSTSISKEATTSSSSIVENFLAQIKGLGSKCLSLSKETNNISKTLDHPDETNDAFDNPLPSSVESTSGDLVLEMSQVQPEALESSKFQSFNATPSSHYDSSSEDDSTVIGYKNKTKETARKSQNLFSNKGARVLKNVSNLNTPSSRSSLKLNVEESSSDVNRNNRDKENRNLNQVNNGRLKRKQLLRKKPQSTKFLDSSQSPVGSGTSNDSRKPAASSSDSDGYDRPERKCRKKARPLASKYKMKSPEKWKFTFESSFKSSNTRHTYGVSKSNKTPLSLKSSNNNREFDTLFSTTTSNKKRKFQMPEEDISDAEHAVSNANRGNGASRHSAELEKSDSELEDIFSLSGFDDIFSPLPSETPIRKNNPGKGLLCEGFNLLPKA